MQKITLISLQHATCLAPDEFKSQLRPWQRVGTGIKHRYVQSIGTIRLQSLSAPFTDAGMIHLHSVVYCKNSCVKLMAEELCTQHLLLLRQITKKLFLGPYWEWMINNRTCNGTEICIISKPHSPAMPETWLKCENKQTHAVLSVCFVISATSRLKKVTQLCHLILSKDEWVSNRLWLA